MKAQIALLMPYRIKDVKKLITKEDIESWAPYSSFNEETRDMFIKLKKTLVKSVSYKGVKRIYISLN